MVLRSAGNVQDTACLCRAPRRPRAGRAAAARRRPPDPGAGREHHTSRIAAPQAKHVWQSDKRRVLKNSVQGLPIAAGSFGTIKPPRRSSERRSFLSRIADRGSGSTLTSGACKAPSDCQPSQEHPGAAGEGVNGKVDGSCVAAWHEKLEQLNHARKGHESERLPKVSNAISETEGISAHREDREMLETMRYWGFRPQ